MSLEIVYNLYLSPNLHIYLANAYIINKTSPNTYGAIKAIATPEIMRSYDLFLDQSPHNPCIDICQKLTETAILERFIKSKKATYDDISKDKVVQKTITLWVQKQLDRLLTMIETHQFVIGHGINESRRLDSWKELLHFSPLTLKPKLRFVKQAAGIDYELFLKANDEVWRPSTVDIIELIDEPGRVLVGQTIYRLADLNAAKIRPFLQKEMVHIPEKFVEEYLTKFVREILKYAEVESNGFDIIKEQPAPVATLQARTNFLTSQWRIEMLLSYGDNHFAFYSTDQSRTKIIQRDGVYYFIVVQRQPPIERQLADILISLGLAQDHDASFIVETAVQDVADSYDIIVWLVNNSDQLKQKGFLIEMPEIEGARLVSMAPKLSIVATSKSDWFDIYGEIVIGDFTIPFSNLLGHIRSENRIFKLSDGTCFIIPIEWMNKYGPMSKWVSVENEQVRLLKSQGSILVTAGLNGADTANEELIKVCFTPSPNIKAVLRPYQHAGVSWLVEHQVNGLGCCLADDMGLGKTLQVICALDYAHRQKENQREETHAIPSQQLSLFEPIRKVGKSPLKALIIMPSSLIFNWSAELYKFIPSWLVCQHIGANRTTDIRILKEYDVVLTSYQTALRDEELFVQIDWIYVVLDESQYIKNSDTKVFKAIQGIKAQHKLCMTGTPIENSLSDLWSQMQFINPNILGSLANFKETYQIPIEKGGREDLIDELKTIVQPYILRRTKKEVLTDLPEKTEQIMYCEMTVEQARLYEKEKSAARNLILEQDVNDPQVRIRIFNTLLRLRQIANHPSLHLSDYIADSGKLILIREQLVNIRDRGQKVLLFSSFTGHLNIVAEYLTSIGVNFVTLTGSSSQTARRHAVQSFQEESSVQFFLISIKAGGTGLNLTAADYVFLLDPWWNPFVEDQAIARVHRIGLEHPIHVIRFISLDTIEEKILKLQAFKKHLASELVDIDSSPILSKEELQYLLA